MHTQNADDNFVRSHNYDMTSILVGLGTADVEN